MRSRIKSLRHGFIGWSFAGLAMLTCEAMGGVAFLGERPSGVRVVAVGASEPGGGLPSLPGSEQDARAIADWFGTFRGADVRLLAGEGATKSAIAEAIVRRAEAADGPPPLDLIVHYSGAAAGGYLLPAGHARGDSNSAISGSEFAQLVKASEARYVWLFLDISGDAGFCGPGALGEALAGGGGLYVFCAAPPGIAAYERKFGGPYTNSLLAGLMGNADRDGNGRVSAYELAAYVAHNYEQWVIGGEGLRPAPGTAPAVYLQGWDRELPAP